MHVRLSGPVPVTSDTRKKATKITGSYIPVTDTVIFIDKPQRTASSL